jgi:hypothetical protein
VASPISGRRALQNSGNSLTTHQLLFATSSVPVPGTHFIEQPRFDARASGRGCVFWKVSTTYISPCYCSSLQELRLLVVYRCTPGARRGPMKQYHLSPVLRGERVSATRPQSHTSRSRCLLRVSASFSSPQVRSSMLRWDPIRQTSLRMLYGNGLLPVWREQARQLSAPS